MFIGLVNDKTGVKWFSLPMSRPVDSISVDNIYSIKMAAQNLMSRR